RVDDGTLAGHGHRFLHGRQLEPRVDFSVESCLDDDVAADDLLEAGEVERYGVGSDANAGEAVAAAFRRRDRLRLNERRTGERDRDARQHCAGAVSDLAEDFARAHLRRRRSGACEQDETEYDWPPK